MLAMARKTKKRERITAAMPTPQRWDMAGRDYEIATAGEEKGRVWMRDSPLERLKSRGILDDRLHGAGAKYRHHWHRAGLQERYAALRMDGTFGGSGESVTDAMSHHRSVYRGAVQHLGIRSSGVVEDLCCREMTLEDVGRKLGWTNRPQAVAAAEALLKDALDRLAYWWGVS